MSCPSAILSVSRIGAFYGGMIYGVYKKGALEAYTQERTARHELFVKEQAAQHNGGSATHGHSTSGAKGH